MRSRGSGNNPTNKKGNGEMHGGRREGFYLEGMWRVGRGIAQLKCNWFVTEYYSWEEGIPTPSL